MEKVGNKLMEKLIEYAQNIEVFTKSEVPEYIKELLDFKFVEHLIAYFAPVFILGFILSVVLLLGYYYRDAIKTSFKSHDPVLAGSFTLMIIPITVVTLMAISHYGKLLQAYKIKVAPRVYIIDYIKGELK